MPSSDLPGQPLLLEATGSLWWTELKAVFRLASLAPPAGLAQQLLDFSLLEFNNCWELGGEQVVQRTTE